MRYNRVGINIDSIDKLILDIYNYSDKINKTLNQMSMIVDSTSTYYNSTIADEYRKNFNLISANFPTICKNINSYADDMIKLKNRFQAIDENLTTIIKQSMLNITNDK